MNCKGGVRRLWAACSGSRQGLSTGKLSVQSSSSFKLASPSIQFLHSVEWIEPLLTWSQAQLLHLVYHIHLKKLLFLAKSCNSSSIQGEREREREAGTQWSANNTCILYAEEYIKWDYISTSSILQVESALSSPKSQNKQHHFITLAKRASVAYAEATGGFFLLAFQNNALKLEQVQECSEKVRTKLASWLLTPILERPQRFSLLRGSGRNPGRDLDTWAKAIKPSNHLISKSKAKCKLHQGHQEYL